MLPLPIALYFLMIAIPVEFNVGTIFMTGVRLVLLATFVPVFLRLFSGAYGKVILTDVLFFIFTSLAIFALAINTPDQAISFGGSYTLELYGSYILARAYIRTPSDFINFCKAVFILILFSLPFAFYETQTGYAVIPGLINKLPYFYSMADFYNEDAGRRLGLERSQVFFVHPIHYGLFCSTAFSLVIVGFKGLFKPLIRYGLSIAICLGVIASVSSGALLPLVLQIGLVAWAYIFSGFKKKWVFLCIFIITAYVVVDTISNRTAIDVFLEYATLSSDTAYGRVVVFEWGMVNVRKNPFLGIGLNNWERPWWKISQSLDNFWLLTTVRYGIPAFLLLVFGFVTVIWRVMWRNVDGNPVVWQLRRAWVFTMIGLVLTLCTVDVWATVMSYVFFMFGAGVWMITANVDLPQAQTAKRVTPPVRDGRPAYTRFPESK